MEIEIEKFQRRKLSGEDFLRGLDYCAKVDINTDVILNFWQKYFSDVKWIMYSEWITLAVIFEINFIYKGKDIGCVLSSDPSKEFLSGLLTEFRFEENISMYFWKIYPKKIDVQ